MNRSLYPFVNSGPKLVPFFCREMNLEGLHFKGQDYDSSHGTLHLVALYFSSVVSALVGEMFF